MKILVLSDSHSSLRLMRYAVEVVKPDAIVHLGDHYDDGEALHELYPHIRFYQVPGNCDRYRCPPWSREIAVERVLGVDLYVTHGHKHSVKQRMDLLLAAARSCGVQAVLYGHTHVANCYRETDGLWVLNPGSCGHSGGSVGLIETERNEILSCRILRLEDLEAFT